MTDQTANPDESTPRYRSGAVARMIRMPVSTLRVWERRYGVVKPAVSASGHRLYSARDVRRLAQIKQLTETGHAIGSIAALSDEALREVASTHATSLTLHGAAPAPMASLPPWRVVVVGQALARRLQGRALVHGIGRPVHVVAVHDDLAQAAAASPGGPVDALLLHTPGIDASTLPQAEAAIARLGAQHAAMLYGHGTTTACAEIAAAGVKLLRDAQDDRALAIWLRTVADDFPDERPGAPHAFVAPEFALAADARIPPRRYDDAALADFAGLSSTIACECPRHVAELLMRLSHFEVYSADCEARSPADAALHAYLGRVAGAARSLLESALERIAIHEGLLRPR